MDYKKQNARSDYIFKVSWSLFFLSCLITTYKISQSLTVPLITMENSQEPQLHDKSDRILINNTSVLFSTWVLKNNITISKIQRSSIQIWVRRTPPFNIYYMYLEKSPKSTMYIKKTLSNYIYIAYLLKHK